MDKKFAIIPVFLMFIATASAQTRGVVRCQDPSGVLSLESPGSLVVIKLLSCGQEVTILGFDNGYVKLQLTGGVLGYVEAKYVQSEQTPAGNDRQIIGSESVIRSSAASPGVVSDTGFSPDDRRRAEHEVKVNELQESKASRTGALAGETTKDGSRRKDSRNTPPRVEVFGGYSYLNADMNDLYSRQSAHGWNASISANVNPWFAAEFDLAGYYKNVYGVSYQAYSYVAGPRINLRPVFIHALFGGDRASFGASGISIAQNSFAGVLGGGVQIPIGNGFAFRGSADYVFSRHNIYNILNPSLPSVTQNNFRISVGIVIPLGARER